ncbi:oxaloacetate tautomerase FAHD1, mitochondrial-like [Saccoglossus kowalevskii]|uniref:oxaloacetate tautomerase n=1 Tax=Saccoglossus kowalevskii TaxID=10224 RepID=A0ABM0GU62_SACKO|nr:PREDICTED: acylpyruvase FAHD1, mitochondrial-like [Saccoglossus kowalevskii]
MASGLSRFVELGRKIVCVGRNYSEHAAELGNKVPTEPVIFLKPTTSYLKEGNAITFPHGSDNLHHEVELGVVIGKPGFQIRESTAMEHIGGYTLALDMTARDIQDKMKKKGLPWTLAKGFDSSCPIGSFIPPDKIPDPHDIEIWLKVNDAMKQQGNTKNMIFKVPFLISFISQFMTLETGDLILTGTPSGVGPVSPGDVITCGLTGLATMTFTVNK